MDKTNKSYSKQLDEIARDKPIVALLLRKSHQCREQKLGQYSEGTRLHGIEELLEHLDAVSETYSDNPQLSKVSFLLKRCKAEFANALEAALAGYHTVAHDAMRSVMEIEFLLRDFSLNVARIDEWLIADSKQLYNRFRPSLLRKRFAEHIGMSANDLPEATDYRGHSMFLHVGPHPNPFGLSGSADESDGFAIDSCFWEIFEHSRRLLIAMHSLADSVQPGILNDHNPENLERLGSAWECTQEMQQIWQQLIGFVAEKQLDIASES